MKKTSVNVIFTNYAPWGLVFKSCFIKTSIIYKPTIRHV